MIELLWILLDTVMNIKTTEIACSARELIGSPLKCFEYCQIVMNMIELLWILLNCYEYLNLYWNAWQGDLFHLYWTASELVQLVVPELVAPCELVRGPPIELGCDAGDIDAIEEHLQIFMSCGLPRSGRLCQELLEGNPMKSLYI